MTKNKTFVPQTDAIALDALKKAMESNTPLTNNLTLADLFAGIGGYKSEKSAQRGGKKSTGITDKFMKSIYENDVELSDWEYYTGDSLVDMEASQAVVAVMAEIMAYPKTRKILMRSALKSRYNAAEHVTYVARLVALMQNGTLPDADPHDRYGVVNVAIDIFLLLDEKFEISSTPNRHIWYRDLTPTQLHTTDKTETAAKAVNNNKHQNNQ